MYLTFGVEDPWQFMNCPLFLKNPDKNNVYRTYFYSVSWNNIMLTAVVLFTDIYRIDNLGMPGEDMIIR